MKKIRCTLLCLTLLSVLCLSAGCRRRQDETTASFPETTSAGAGMTGGTMNESGNGTMSESSSGATGTTNDAGMGTMNDSNNGTTGTMNETWNGTEGTMN